ncbi:MAG: PLP-dependent aminotransferase family protein [Dermatophilaceae bacterium]
MSSSHTSGDGAFHEILLGLGDQGSGSLVERLRRALRSAVESGQVRAGERLPPSRTLAADLGVSRWVVTEAYEQLAAEGYLSTRVGSGTRVAASLTTSRPGSLDAHISGADAGSSPVLDLRPGVPDLSSFPRSAWLRSYSTAMRSLSTADLGYPPLEGLPRLRDIVARYVYRVRGIDITAQDVVVTGGTTSAMALLAPALSRVGVRSLATENPGWPRLPEIARRHGVATLPVRVDGEGLVVEDLPTAADAVLTSPAHQFPLGVAMSASRRRALLRWAADSDGLVLEDDYDAEFRYDRRPMPAVAATDPSRVVYLGSTSKTLAPALRTGWLVAPAPVREAVLAGLDDSSAPSPPHQLALAVMMDGGAYDRHLRARRRVYRERRDALVGALGSLPTGCSVMGLAAGLNLVITVPDSGVENRLVALLAAKGVMVTGVGSYADPREDFGVVLSYARLPTRAAPGAADDVRAAVAAAMGGIGGG